MRSVPVKALVDLALRGAVAERLVPVFPTNTFPNHVSLVTGVTPALHGIVNNVFLDPERGLFRYSGDPSWIEVEPLWSLVARHGVVSASYHWVGSEGPWRSGLGARHWVPFSLHTPESRKVDQILAWLDEESPAERPRLITSWFRGADAAAHHSGPGSKPAVRALRAQDRALARLVAGLDRRRAFETTTLLVVSDHGMADVRRTVDLRQALDAADIDARVFGGGGISFVSLDRGPRDAERVRRVARSLGLDARRTAADAATANPRFGDVVVLAPVGTGISSRTGAMAGAHGYLPEEPAMGALLVAAGRGVRPGTRLGAVRTVDVAPTVLAWLGIDVPPWMVGRPIEALVANTSEAATAPGSTGAIGERP